MSEFFVDVGIKPKEAATPPGPVDEKIFKEAPEGSGIYLLHLALRRTSH